MSKKFLNPSKERSYTQVFGAGKSEGMALAGGLHAYLPQKDINKKVNLEEQCQDANFFFIRANLILIL